MAKFLDDLRARINALPAVEIGYPEDVVGDFVDIVRINFLGSSDGQHPPPRPLLDEAAVLAAPEVRELNTGADLARGGAAAEAALLQMGETVARHARTILESGSVLEPNAPSTIAAKGDSRPLRDPSGEDRFLKLLTVRLVPRR